MARRPRPTRRARLGRLIGWSTTLALLATIGGYGAYALALPIPEPQLSITNDLTTDQATEVTLSTDEVERAVTEETLPTAIGWLESDDIWSNDDTAYPLASISKLIAVLVTLEEAPLDPDPNSWGTYTWTQADAARQQYYQSLGGVTFPMPVGTEITMEDLFRLIFLPSANDAVTAYVLSVFPNNDAFVEAVDTWADRQGLESLKLVEPTGLDEGNVASAADIVRVARLALNHPIVMQHTVVKEHTILGETIENTNPLLGEEPRILGLKTGRSLIAGFNFLVAQTTSIEGRELTKISVTLGRGSVEERAQSGWDMLAKLDPLPQNLDLVTEGDEVGTITYWDGEPIPVTLAAGASAVFLPGETAIITLTLHETPDAPRETSIGILTIDAVTGEQHIELIADRVAEHPPLSWRLLQPLQTLRTP